MDFQVSVKPPPIPSNEITNAIEKMIKLRIKDDLYDDPIRKKNINLNKREKHENDLDFDKSKKGLGDIYEDDYNNQETGNATEAESKELYKEIDDLGLTDHPDSKITGNSGARIACSIIGYSRDPLLYLD